MASIRTYRAANGERRYSVRYRDPQTRPNASEPERATSVTIVTALLTLLDVGQEAVRCFLKKTSDIPVTPEVAGFESLRSRSSKHLQTDPIMLPH